MLMKLAVRGSWLLPRLCCLGLVLMSVICWSLDCIKLGILCLLLGWKVLGL